MVKRIFFTFTILFLLLTATACGAQTKQPAVDSKLQVVATTTIVGDVLHQIGGDQIDLEVLLPLGADPHSFDPSPKDVAKIVDSDVVFANGGGVEAFLNILIESANAENKLVYVSEGVDYLEFEGDDHGDEEEAEDHAEDVDPHTWTDPNNVMVWVENILRVLSKEDPRNEAYYQANAERFEAELKELDSWIRNRVDQIPIQNRKLVTDHALFGYFSEEYGFEQIGALIPGFSTLSEPTAKELAEIEDSILKYRVKAVFVGRTVNPSLADRVSSDTGVKLVYVYTGSLSDVDGDAATYLDYMRYNTNAFVDALK